MPIKDITNQRFGMLTVTSRAENAKNGTARWNCICDCGTTTTVRGDSLRRGVTTSCGCFVKMTGVKKNYSQIDVICDACSKVFKDKPSSYARKKHHFCSTKCYSAFQKTLPFYKQNAYKGVRDIGDSKQIYHRNYCKNHPDVIAHLKARRYARERGAEGNHSLSEWENLKKSFKYKCAFCSEQKPLTKDHIVPLSKGGTDYITNIQPLCRNCNSKKHNKTDFQFS